MTLHHCLRCSAFWTDDNRRPACGNGAERHDAVALSHLETTKDNLGPGVVRLRVTFAGERGIPEARKTPLDREIEAEMEGVRDRAERARGTAQAIADDAAQARRDILRTTVRRDLTARPELEPEVDSVASAILAMFAALLLALVLLVALASWGDGDAAVGFHRALSAAARIWPR